MNTAPTSGNLQSHIFACSITTLICMSLYLNSSTLWSFQVINGNSEVKDLEILWTSIEKEVHNDKERFVEANPSAPTNKPDETKNFSFQDQQAAQEENSHEAIVSDSPELDGKTNSNKILSSPKKEKQTKQIPKIPPLPKNEKLAKKIDLSSTLSATPSLFEQKAAIKNNPDGITLDQENIANERENRLINLLKRERKHENKLDFQKENLARLDPQPALPFANRTRPKISPEILHGPIMKTTSNAPRIGKLAIECRLHPYGIYIQQMLRSIEDQWHQLTAGSLRYIQRDKLRSKITFRFALSADGTIKDLKEISGGDNSIAAEICRQAIASRVPYGEWSQKMVEDFGLSDVITIHFNYL